MGSVAPVIAAGMRHLLDPRLVNGPFGDTGLCVDLRDERPALLFDLGDIFALPPRKLLRLSHVFISHAHMDHFFGFDALLRVVLGRNKRLTLIGGPDLVAQVAHKLRAYTWNVGQRYEVALFLEVLEFHPNGRMLPAAFDSVSGFARDSSSEDGRLAGEHSDVLLDDAMLRVRGRFVAHGMPCLDFAIEEVPRPRVAKNRLAEMGLGTGPWLRELRLALLSGADASVPLQLCWRDRLGEHTLTRSVRELDTLVLDVSTGLRIGYVTDLGGTEANRRVLASLRGRVDRLDIESCFLHADREHAQRKHHLTARQIGAIAGELRDREQEPFHFSLRYLKRAGAPAAEAQAAWQAAMEAAAAEAAHRQAVEPTTSAAAGGGPGGSARSWTKAMR